MLARWHKCQFVVIWKGINNGLYDINSLFASFSMSWMIITTRGQYCSFAGFLEKYFYLGVIINLDVTTTLCVNIKNCGNTSQEVNNTQGDNNAQDAQDNIVTVSVNSGNNSQGDNNAQGKIKTYTKT